MQNRPRHLDLKKKKVVQLWGFSHVPASLVNSALRHWRCEDDSHKLFHSFNQHSIQFLCAPSISIDFGNHKRAWEEENLCTGINKSILTRECEKSQHETFLVSPACLFIRLSVSPFVCASVCLSVSLSVCPFLCPSVRFSVRLSVSLSVCPSVRFSVRLSVSLSVCPFLCPSVRLSVCPSVRLSVCPSVRLSVCPSACLFISPSVSTGQEGKLARRPLVADRQQLALRLMQRHVLNLSSLLCNFAEISALAPIASLPN